jgi:hypothetical protein
MPVVVAHGWVALASLVVALATAASLAGAYVGLPILERRTGLALHVVFAAYGFMGMLTLGLSYIAIPMFVLSASPDERRARASWGLAVAALALAAAAAFIAPRAPGIAAALRLAAIGFAGGGAVVHLALMRAAIVAGMRRETGISFRLIGLGWACLVASLAAGAAVALDAPSTGIATLFGILLVGGWLLSFALGVLQRIVPFLAAMHASGAKPRSPAPSTLAASQPLVVHAACHAAALATLVAAYTLQSGGLVAIAAAVGTTGAAAFALFFAIVVRRMRRARATIPKTSAGPAAHTNRSGRR